MSVIGRLDDQVEAVLINPLRRERAPVEEGERDAPPLPPPAASQVERERQAPDDERREGDHGSLPVWML